MGIIHATNYYSSSMRDLGANGIPQTTTKSPIVKKKRKMCSSVLQMKIVKMAFSDRYEKLEEP